MSKKILSVALAVVMLVSAFAFSASAAVTVDTVFPAAGQGGYRVVSDAYVGMPAGETVTVKVYYVFPSGTDYDALRVGFTGNTVLAFTDAFNYVADSRVWGDSYSYMKASANINTNFYTTASKNFSANDTAKGWSKAMLVQKTLDTAAGSGYSSTTGHPIDPECELYSIQFTTTRALTAADTIGIPEGAAGKTVLFQTKAPTSGSIAAGDIVLGDAMATADYVDVNDTATGKMRPNADDSTKVDLACTGTVKEAAFEALCAGGLTWDGIVSNEITAVKAQYRINGVVEEATTTCIYPDNTDGTGGFKFRAALTGIDEAGLSELIEIRMAMTVNGTVYYSNWQVVDANTVYDAAVANGMTAIA